jgi:hypothetical protein
VQHGGSLSLPARASNKTFRGKIKFNWLAARESVKSARDIGIFCGNESDELKQI